MIADFEDKLRDRLRLAYSETEPSSNLLGHCQTLLAVEPDERQLKRRPARLRNRWRLSRWLPPVAAAAVVAAAATVIIATAQVRHHAPAPAAADAVSSREATSGPTRKPSSIVSTGAESPIAISPGEDLGALCSRPSSSFAQFWYLTTAGNQTSVFSGSVRIGAMMIPAMAVYVSSGPPGIGVLCVSNLVAPYTADQPIRSAVGALPRPIAYLAADNSGIPYLAVSPEVVSVSVAVGAKYPAPPPTYRYTPAGTEQVQLQPIGAGWHVLALGVGYSNTTLTVRAYSADDAIIDIRKLAIP